MTVTLYADTDFKGCSQSFARDKPNLKETKVGNNPSSIKLTRDDEAVLLFKKEDWKGGALFICGPREVSNLGSKSAGGKTGFKNGITSLRRTPFELNLNVTVVNNTNGDYPGRWTFSKQAEAEIGTIVDHVNAFYDQNRALLRLNVVLCTPRLSNPYFVIKPGGANYPATWKRSGTIDVVFVDSFKKEDKSAKSKPPMFGQTLTISGKVFDENRELEAMARSLAHELGHYLGIHHASANKNKRNLMYVPPQQGESIFQNNLRPDQIRLR